jgi:hypothetical protein
MVLKTRVAADARFCGPVQLDSLILERLTRKIQAATGDDGATALTAAQIKEHFRKLWHCTIKEDFDGSDGKWPIHIRGDLTVEFTA